MDDETLNTLLSILVSAAILIVPLLAAYIARILKKYTEQLDQKVRAETTSEEYAFLMQLAELAVSAAEQAIPGSNEEKLNYAMRQLHRIATQNRIPLSATDSRMLIEGVLKGVKLGLQDPVVLSPVLQEGTAQAGSGLGAVLDTDGPEPH